MFNVAHRSADLQGMMSDARGYTKSDDIGLFCQPCAKILLSKVDVEKDWNCAHLIIFYI